jgi:RNA polymerase sigma-70 factor, ECF subfamily
MRDEVADEKLMEQYRDGDAGSFDILYHRHKGGLFRYLFRLCNNQGIAEELFQDVWSNLIRSRERYQPTAKFTTFLYRIAHNRVIDHVRRNPGIMISLDLGPNQEMEEEDEPMIASLPANPAEQPEKQAERKQMQAQLVQQLEALPALQREAFLLREEAGMSLLEIAEATGVNEETAKSRLRYAVAKLREGLRGV